MAGLKHSHNHIKIVVYSDGAARGNPGPAGAGGLIESETGQVLNEVSEYLGETTNNVAEYKALILALEQSLEYGAEEIEVRSDSELLVRQLIGRYKVKNEKLKPLFEQTRQLLSRFKRISIKHIYRQENTRADKLANEAIDRFVKGEAFEDEKSDIPTKRAESPVDAKNMPTREDFEQGTLF